MTDPERHPVPPDSSASGTPRSGSCSPADRVAARPRPPTCSGARSATASSSSPRRRRCCSPAAFPAPASPTPSGARRTRSTTCSAASRTSRRRTTPTGSCSATAAPSTAAPTGPTAPDSFFASVGSSHAAELDRYDAVIFFETAAAGGHGFESENRFRTESQQEAIDLDARAAQHVGRSPRVHAHPPHAPRSSGR